MNFIQELKWRGMIHDIMPGNEEQFQNEMTSAYIGFDPTADSLHIGSLVQIMILVHLQNAGHKPYALVGGATGMVGDPSGKSKERNLLDKDTLDHNLNCVKKQLEKFLDFNCGDNSAVVINNYDWFENMSFLEFIRDNGKHISVNYMMAKDSVKSRLSTGMSFTEFSYQLVQGYDFYWLWKNKNCKVQLGGSDQWGNIVTGTELIRRKEGGNADFLYGIKLDFNPFYVTYCLIKITVFAFIVSSVSSYFGYYTKGGALDVGRSSTKAVVYSSIIVLIFNFILTDLLLA